MYLIWQLRVLRRSDIVQRLLAARIAQPIGNSADSLRSFRNWRFSLATLLWAVTFAAIVLVRLTSENVRYEVRHVSTPYGFEYRVRSSRLVRSPDELAYVLFDERRRSLGTWRMSGLRPLYYEVSGVMLPNGETIVLPGRHQLYEIVDGTLHARDERVTLSELEGFMNSQPTECSPASTFRSLLVRNLLSR